MLGACASAGDGPCASVAATAACTVVGAGAGGEMRAARDVTRSCTASRTYITSGAGMGEEGWKEKGVKEEGGKEGGRE